jgi:hypothetical protein
MTIKKMKIRKRRMMFWVMGKNKAVLLGNGYE